MNEPNDFYANMLNDISIMIARLEFKKLEAGADTVARVIDTAANLLRAGASIYYWRSVEDKLPSVGETVLATDGDYYFTAMMRSDEEWFKYNEYASDPIAWTRIEAYTPEEDEDD